MDRYDPHAIDRRWQEVWERERTWEVPNPGDPGFDGAKPKFYVLEMLPYPSGEPHVGHLKNYAIGDAVAHVRRRQGFSVIHPMGYDAFGLPAENNAIQTGTAPREATERSIESYRRHFRSWGVSIDWSREISTHDPAYYRWTQWIFLRLLERDLAYRTEAPVHWCPKDQTVLANEQVIDGRCERCGTTVEQRFLEQWFFRITDYADRLLANLDDKSKMDWSESTVLAQRNWLGRSEGAEIEFPSAAPAVTAPLPRGPAAPLRVFTTRPDTIFGATFMVLAPEHPLVDAFTTAEQRAEVDAYRRMVAAKDLVSRKVGDREKTGVFTGGHAVNPATGQPIPVWIADYVLMEYGTGAIMAVPGHDQRDFEFA